MKKFFKGLMSITVVFTFALALFACSAMPKGGEGNLGVEGLPDWASGDRFNEIKEMPFISAVSNPTTYFGLDVSTASYSVLKRAITNNKKIYPDMVRAEDMLNYFSYSMAAPDSGLALGAEMMDCPYNENTKLLSVNVKAEEVSAADKANNIVFLIDSSGSMDAVDKLGLVQASIVNMLEILGEDDRISVVTYAGSSDTRLSGVSGDEKKRIRNAIEDLTAGGSTNGEGGINSAYAAAQKHFIEGGNNMVILCTDGDFNVGISSQNGLKRLVEEKRRLGVYLSVFGYGIGNLKDDLMETLAQNGNGVYHYVSDITDARKAMVEGAGGLLNIVAKDTKAGVTFNAELVESYRLIGYENNIMSAEDFDDGNKDAGEIGSGHTVSAMFEVKLKSGVAAAQTKIADVIVRYKDASDGSAKEINLSVEKSMLELAPTQDMRFKAAVIEFALILRESDYKASAALAGVQQALEGLECVRSDVYKAEFLQLVNKYSLNVKKA